MTRKDCSDLAFGCAACVLFWGVLLWQVGLIRACVCMAVAMAELAILWATTP